MIAFHKRGTVRCGDLPGSHAGWRPVSCFPSAFKLGILTPEPVFPLGPLRPGWEAQAASPLTHSRSCSCGSPLR